ncbi:MAG: ABC transporter ATP-binding protein [Alphaproteobacteria bacterium]
MSALLKLSGLRKNFGPTEIIRGVDLEIEDGERHAIIGPNGAGKSTLFHLISGRYDVTAGHIHLREREITNRAPYEINRMGLARSFQVTNIFPKMTVFENILVGVLWEMGARYAFWRFVSRDKAVQARTAEILERTGMADRRDVPAGLLSYADQRALEIAITLGSNPDLIMLDEPTAGMSRSETQYAVDLIRDVSEQKTLIMVEHDMGVVFDLADRISVLVYGEVIATDTPARIRANQAVQEAYLGTMED